MMGLIKSADSVSSVVLQQEAIHFLMGLTLTLE